MLNIGPRANGDVPYEISERMLHMGKWLDVNGESIYGAQAFDLDKDQHDWGKITYKMIEPDKHRLYLHVLIGPCRINCQSQAYPQNHQKPTCSRTK